TELDLERGTCRLGDLVERVRVLDPERAVAGDEVVEVLGRDRPATADVGVVRRHVLEPVRRAVRHEHHGDVAHATIAAVRSWTSSTSLPSEAGSVWGRTPCPRLKMWPGLPPARARTSRAAASTRSHGPSSTAGSRLPWTPRPSPTSAQPRSSGTRQSRPITSPPARAIEPSSAAVPVPKWIVGAPSTAARTRPAS